MNMNTQTKTNERMHVTSPVVFSRESARYIQEELGEILEKIRTVWVDVDEEDRLCLDIAEENIEEVYDRFRDKLEA
jgi:hypothetical protein